MASSGTMDAGCRYLYEGLAAGRIVIHPRCELMAKALETWDYTRDHPLKDSIDAWRYSVKVFIFRPGSIARNTVRFR